MLNHSLKVRLIYKTILRLHRGLPAALSELGTSYAREEFKRHKNCNETEASIFLNEWTDYAITISKQLGLKGVKSSRPYVGAYIEENKLEDFREDQLGQLYELMLAAAAQPPENEKNKNNEKIT